MFFCPSGMGFDTFRLWETLSLGAIPIVESNVAGMDRTYGSLPVVVQDFRDVTESLLHEAYACFRRHAREGAFLYRHLTMSYWRDVLLEVQRTGDTAMYNNEHPTANKYCNFLVQIYVLLSCN